MISARMIALLLVGFINRIYERWARQNVFKKAAPFLITTGVGAMVPSLWEIIITKSFASYDAAHSLKVDGGVDLLQIAGCFLVVSGVVFYIVSHFCKVDDSKELIFDKKIYGPFLIGRARVNCYSGSVTQISDVDVVVTSEDTDLNLGSLSGTSVSGRIRNMAATHGPTGIQCDNLSNWMQSWKQAAGVVSNIPLGTTIPLDNAYGAASHGVKAIVFAVAVRKNPNRVGTIEKPAIDQIVQKSLNYASSNGYKSIFIPVFGLGSGNVPSSTALSYTVNSVCDYLAQGNHDLDVYIGVYTFPDTLKLTTLLPKW